MLEKMPRPSLRPVLVFEDMKKMKHAHTATATQLTATKRVDCLRTVSAT